MSKSKQANSTLRLLAICGIVAVVWFNLIVLIAGSMYEGYDHLYRFMSELGMTVAPTGWFFNLLGFGFYGVLIILFGIGLYVGRAGRIGSGLFIISSVGLFIVALAPVDIAYSMHMVGFVILVGGTILMFLAFAESMRRNEGWKDLWKYTLITAIVYSLFFIAHQYRLFGEFVGLSQRVLSWISWLWVLVIAYRLYRISQSSQ